MAYLYPYGDTQQLNLDWLIEQWNEVKSQIDGSLQAEIDRVEDAITDLLTARDEAVAAQTAAQASAQAAAGSASTASGAASTATAQAQAAAASAATAGAHSSDAQGYSATAQQQAQAAQNSAGAAANSANTANGAKQDAQMYAQQAAGSAQNAQMYAQQAAGSAQNAQGYAVAAQGYANDAAHSAEEAQDILDSIPADYTDLSNEVDELSAAVNELTPEVEATFEQKTIENVQIASFNDGADNVPIKSVAFNIIPLQSGFNAPSPTNIRPFTGWTQAVIINAKKNLFDKTNVESGYFLPNGNDAGSSASDRYRSDYIPVMPNTPYYFTNICPASATTQGFWYDKDKNIINGVGFGQGQTYATSGTQTSANNAAFVRFVCYKANVDSVMLNIGNTQTDFEAYTSTQKTIGFPAEANTVYGGILEYLNDEWKLTVTHGYGTADANSTWGYSSATHRFYTAQDGMILAATNDAYNGTCNMYNPHPGGAIVDQSISYWGTNAARVCFAEDSCTTVDEWKTFLGNNTIEYTYPLETPIEYTLTSEEVIKTVLGINNIWTASGEIAEITYRVMNNTEAKLTLVKAIIAPVLDNMIADTALVVNDFRIVDNTLYRITTPVASGATLIPGTNCTATTIAAILKTLLS